MILNLPLASKLVLVTAVVMLLVASSNMVEVKAAISCSNYCGTSAYLDTNVGLSTSRPVTAFYFYNDSYSPSEFLTSNNIQCPIQFSIFDNNQFLTINGIVESISNSTSGFIFALQFRAVATTNPLLELQSNQYTANGGTVDPFQFSSWGLTQGTIAGYGSFQGVSLTMSEFSHPFQIGVGANGKNLNFGAGGWLSYINERGQEIQTDLNVDLSCSPNGGSGSNCSAATTCSSHGACSADGSCYCYTGYAGSNCGQCATGYSGYPNCAATCNAATTCSSYGTCAADGTCVCNTGYSGSSCNQCATGYYNYPACVACNAATTCSSHGTCGSNGSCVCDTGYTGASCNQCSSGYTGYPTCTSLTGGIVTNPTSSTVSSSANMVSVGGLALALSVTAVVILA